MPCCASYAHALEFCATIQFVIVIAQSTEDQCIQKECAAVSSRNVTKRLNLSRLKQRPPSNKLLLLLQIIERFALQANGSG